MFIFMRARESRCIHTVIAEHAIDTVHFVGLICFQIVLVQSEVSNPKNIYINKHRRAKRACMRYTYISQCGKAYECIV